MNATKRSRRTFSPAVAADPNWSETWDRPEVQLEQWRKWNAGDADALLPLLELLQHKFGPFWPGCGLQPRGRAGAGSGAGVPHDQADAFDDFALETILRWFQKYDPASGVPVVAWVGLNCRRFLLKRWVRVRIRDQGRDPFAGHVRYLEDMAIARNPEEPNWEEWLC